MCDAIRFLERKIARLEGAAVRADRREDFDLLRKLDGKQDRLKRRLWRLQDERLRRDDPAAWERKREGRRALGPLMGYLPSVYQTPMIARAWLGRTG